MRDKRIPTILGLLVIFSGLIGTIFLTKNTTNFFSKADISAKPKNILISNLKGDQFAVSWTSDNETEGYISYGSSKALGNLAFDKRDQSEKRKYKNHYVLVNGLEKGKTYFFKIGSKNLLYGGEFNLSQNCQDYINNLNDNSFRVTLPSVDTNSLRSIPVNGSVFEDSSGKNPTAGAIVCLQIQGALPLSEITSNSGVFVIPLYSVLGKDQKLLTNFSDNMSEQISVLGQNGKISMATLTSAQDHPVPSIILGKNYEFGKNVNANKTTPQPSPQPTNNPSLSPTTSINLSPTPAVEIATPSGDIFDTLPTFRGKGKPGQILDIKVDSPEEYTGTVKVDGTGSWVWTPPANLSTGQHTVTVTTKDDSGNINKIVKLFTVLAANPILPVSAGTPSAQIIPSPTLIPTATPTLVPTPTSIPTLIPSVTPELMQSGNSSLYFVFLTMGMISVTLGILMVFKKT